MLSCMYKSTWTLAKTPYNSETIVGTSSEAGTMQVITACTTWRRLIRHHAALHRSVTQRQGASRAAPLYASERRPSLQQRSHEGPIPCSVCRCRAPPLSTLCCSACAVRSVARTCRAMHAREPNCTHRSRSPAPGPGATCGVLMQYHGDNGMETMAWSHSGGALLDAQCHALHLHSGGCGYPLARHQVWHPGPSASFKPPLEPPPS
jgi:hypothetical protein